jgi:hypothetical protein
MAVILTGRLLIDLPFSVIAIEPSMYDEFLFCCSALLLPVKRQHLLRNMRSPVVIALGG